MGDDRMSGRQRLTPKLIDDLDAREKRYEVADVTTPAMKVRITSNGAKTLSAVYRSPVTHRKSRVWLGRWPTAPGTDKADFLRRVRIEAAQVLAEVARGEDPALLRRESKRARRERDKAALVADRQAERRALTFGAVAEEYLDDANTANLRSWSRIESQIRFHWQRSGEAVWNTPIDEVRAPQFKTRIDGFIRERKWGSAAQAKKHAGYVMTFAVRMGYAQGNPVSALRITRKGLDARTTARALDPVELGAAWVATFDIKEPWATAYRLLMLTACRKTEVFSMAWELVGDEDGAHFWIPAEVEKMERGRRVELSELAAKQLASISRRDGARYVFEDRLGKHWLTGHEKTKAAWTDRTIEILKEHGRSGTSFRLHDLRHAFKTWAASERIDVDVSEQILGHRKQGISGRYNHARLIPEQREALESYANAIAAAGKQFER